MVKRKKSKDTELEDILVDESVGVVKKKKVKVKILDPKVKEIKKEVEDDGIWEEDDDEEGTESYGDANFGGGRRFSADEMILESGQVQSDNSSLLESSVGDVSVARKEEKSDNFYNTSSSVGYADSSVGYNDSNSTGYNSGDSAGYDVMNAGEENADFVRAEDVGREKRFVGEDLKTLDSKDYVAKK